jgi:hypothetical protein
MTTVMVHGVLTFSSVSHWMSSLSKRMRGTSLRTEFERFEKNLYPPSKAKTETRRVRPIGSGGSVNSVNSVCAGVFSAWAAVEQKREEAQ